MRATEEKISFLKGISNDRKKVGQITTTRNHLELNYKK